MYAWCKKHRLTSQKYRDAFQSTFEPIKIKLILENENEQISRYLFKKLPRSSKCDLNQNRKYFVAYHIFISLLFFFKYYLYFRNWCVKFIIGRRKNKKKMCVSRTVNISYLLIVHIVNFVIKKGGAFPYKGIHRRAAGMRHFMETLNVSNWCKFMK